mmetsp:Transcript_2984/g.10774  ORF Transcript_2984/g.10774 Transcript_2984/m.10774 type:complete len:306 (-) Transcript_2984:608-1525(-)
MLPLTSQASGLHSRSAGPLSPGCRAPCPSRLQTGRLPSCRRGAGLGGGRLLVSASFVQQDEDLGLELDRLVDSAGMISIVGFGSLLSRRSCLSTFGAVKDFRPARLKNYRRVFAHLAPIFIRRGIANLETKEMSSLSVEPCPGESIVVSLFELSSEEIGSFIEREHEFRFTAVQTEEMDGTVSRKLSVACTRFSDVEYRARCEEPDGASKEEQEQLKFGVRGGEYFERYGQYEIDRIWRDDLLPCPLYLRHCVLAAQALGEEAFNSFLDDTFLGDRTTTIRQYLSRRADIMELVPPPELAERYNG